jgi:hypothetical protein
MKLLMTLALSTLPLAALADDENILAGQYADCVQWTTMNGVPTSKKFELIFDPTNALHFAASYYEGSATCEGGPKEVRRYERFTVVQDSGNRRVRLITAQDEDSKLYFKFVLSMDSAIIYTGDSLPVKPDAMRSMILNRTN